MGTGKGKSRPVKEELMIFRKNEWARGVAGRCEGGDKLWVWYWLLASSPGAGPGLPQLVGRGFVTAELLLEHLSLGRKGEFRESCSLRLLIFECLHLKIATTPKQPILGDSSSSPAESGF